MTKRCANMGHSVHPLMIKTDSDNSACNTNTQHPPSCVLFEKNATRCCPNVVRAFGSMFKILWMVRILLSMLATMHQQKTRAQDLVEESNQISFFFLCLATFLLCQTKSWFEPFQNLLLDASARVSDVHAFFGIMSLFLTYC